MIVMTAGRKKIYDPNTFPLLAEQYARTGLSDKQIAKNLNISLTVYYSYQIQFPEFSEAIKRGKKPVDVEVENALLKRALGFEYDEIHTDEWGVDKNGDPIPIRIRTIKKYIPPDVGAIVFWLKNRNPDLWKERQHSDITTNGKELIFGTKELTNEEAIKRLKELEEEC